MNKKVAIAGFGLEGKAMLEYLLSSGVYQAEGITVFDENSEAMDGYNLPEGVGKQLGSDAMKRLGEFDVISRSPAIRPDSLPESAVVTSVTIEFFDKCPAPIIAVTGTKGKGTTSSLIAKILEAAGQKVHLLGNIGLPAVVALNSISQEDYVVYEISSFQLWDLKKSPHIAVVLMVTEDHLDVHTDVEEYRDSKSSIAKYQKSEDICIYHPTNPNSKKIAEGPGRHLKFMDKASGGAYIDQDYIWVKDQKICAVADVGLIGAHNLENVTAAITSAWEITQNVEAIRAAVQSFEGLEHRLELVREIDGVKYVNDSISTVPDTAIAGLNAFTEKKHVFLGGSDKGQSYSELVQRLGQGDVLSVTLIGVTGAKIGEELESLHPDIPRHTFVSMTESLKTLSATARSGEMVLLSPGAASFGDFKNYQDRAHKFKAAVNSMEGR